MHLFLAKNCVKTSARRLDVNEHLTVTEVSLDKRLIWS